MKKIKNLIFLFVVMMMLLATTSYAQTPSKPASSQPGVSKVTNQQLRVELANTQDALIFANSNLARCDQAYNDLKTSSNADQNAILAAAAERKVYADLVSNLTVEVSTLKQALADQKEATNLADKRADTAIKEVDRQKKKVSFWKKAAKYGTLIGAAAGAAAVLIIQR